MVRSAMTRINQRSLPSLRRVLLQVHLWMGIVAGLYLSLLSVTGAALVFRIELQRVAYPDLFTPGSQGPAADPVTVMERVQAAYPDGTLSGIDAPTTTRPTYLAYVSKGKQFATVLIDPVTARVLGELPERSIIRTLQELHFDLLAGRRGRTLNGIGACMLLAMSITGVALWWPRGGTWGHAFAVDLRGSPRRAIRDLHAAVGIWSVLLIVIWSMTGIYFAFPAAFRAMVNRVSTVSVNRAPQSGPPRDNPPSWRALIDKARALSAAPRVARIVMPAGNRSAWLVMFSPVAPTPAGTDLTEIYLDRYTGELLKQPSAAATIGDRIIAAMTPLHIGSFGGYTVKAVWLLCGLAPAALFISGAVMAWIRFARRRTQPTSSAAGAG